MRSGIAPVDPFQLIPEFLEHIDPQPLFTIVAGDMIGVVQPGEGIFRLAELGVLLSASLASIPLLLTSALLEKALSTSITALLPEQRLSFAILY